jgi:hypothetical protein
MDPISIPAHFDGQKIVLDEPRDLEVDAKLLVTVLPIIIPNVSRGWASLPTVCARLTVMVKKNTPLI